MKRKYIIDSLFVLLNILSISTIIPYLLFSRSLTGNVAIIFILTFIYLIIRFKQNIKIPKDSLFIVYIIILGYSIANTISYSLSLSFSFLIITVSNIFFYILLYNIYYDYHRFNTFETATKRLITGYSWLCWYQLALVIVMLLLTDIFNLFNPLINDVSYNYAIFSDNVNNLDARYFFPYNICIFSFGSQRLPFFHKYGNIYGIFHEPHVMTYYVVPFLFLMHGFIKKKIYLLLIDILFVIYILIAASVTNILSVMLVSLFWLLFKSKKKIIVLSFAICLIIAFLTIDNPLLDLIKFRINYSGSLKYSQNLLSYAFTPKTFFGTTIFDTRFVKHYISTSQKFDVGYIVFILNIIFLSIFIYRTLFLCFASNKIFNGIGYFSLYYILHSAKLALNAYTYPILIFVMFIVTISYKEKVHLIKQYVKT